MMIDILQGDCLELLKQLPDDSVQCCVTSPPYWGLRDYEHNGQVGAERTPQEYVDRLTTIFREVRRVLCPYGTLWLNLGDTYAMDSKWGGRTGGKHAKGLHGGNDARKARRHTGLPDKSVVGIPWKVAFALQADGWYLRQEIIWHKPNAMPESVKDRCTKAHEYVFLLTKGERYFYDNKSIQEIASDGYGTRNRRTVWEIATAPFPGAHFAVFPPKLVEPCILAGCPINGVVLDPFAGTGTTGEVANKHGRKSLLLELNPEYVSMIKRRCGLAS